jgi:hypothetical protein
MDRGVFIRSLFGDMISIQSDNSLDTDCQFFGLCNRACDPHIVRCHPCCVTKSQQVTKADLQTMLRTPLVHNAKYNTTGGQRTSPRPTVPNQDQRQYSEITSESEPFKAVKKRAGANASSPKSVVPRFVQSLAAGNITPRSGPVVRLKVSICKSSSSVFGHLRVRTYLHIRRRPWDAAPAH